MLNLVKIAFKDAIQRDGEAEYYTDAIRNTFLGTVVARTAPKTPAEAFTVTQKNHRLSDWSLPKGMYMGWDGPLETISQWKGTVESW